VDFGDFQVAQKSDNVMGLEDGRTETPGSGPWAAELTGWFCEAEQFFLRLPT
jgi:hypothetical protein